MPRFEWGDSAQTYVVVVEQGEFWCASGTCIANGDKLPTNVIPSPEWEYIQAWLARGGQISAFGTARQFYAARRRAAYPQSGDQLDALWKMVAALIDPGGWALNPGTAEMLATIQAVKAKFPKPE